VKDGRHFFLVVTWLLPWHPLAGAPIYTTRIARFNLPQVALDTSKKGKVAPEPAASVRALEASPAPETKAASQGGVLLAEVVGTQPPAAIAGAQAAAAGEGEYDL